MAEDLFKNTHPDVQRLAQQAQREQRLEARKKFWSEVQKVPGQYKSLPKPTKPQ